MAVTTERTVAVTFPIDDEMRSAIDEALGQAATVAFVRDMREGERLEALRGSEVILAWNWLEIGASESEAMRELRFVQLLSAGADHVPHAALPTGVVIASNVGAYAEPMAEHVAAMALALAKRLPHRHAELARGEFHQFPPTRALHGSVCGILGFGGIGRATGRLMRAFGARIHAINTTGRTNEPVEFVGTLQQLDRVVGASDIVVIALPLTKATRGLIGARELSLMNPDAILVNVARGGIIDQAALFEHLRAHPEFMAGIDAWWTEPFGQGEFRTDFPFFELPNVLGSPHNSAIVPGIQIVAARRAAENVLRYLRNEPLRGVVRREDYA